MKLHVKSLNEGSKDDHYVVQNLIWSGVYLRITFSNTILEKVSIMVPLTATGTEVYFSTIETVISDLYYALEENLNVLKILKLKSYPG